MSINASVSTLPGVTLLSDIFVQNQTVLNVSRVIDEGGDLTNFFYLGIPFLLLWFAGIGFVTYYTDDDGYVTGARKIESKHLVYRFLATILIYVLEGVQLAACAFGPAAVQSLSNGEEAMRYLGALLFRGADFEAAFPAVVTLEILMVLVMFVPAVLWKTLPRDLYNKFAERYVYGPFGPVISFVQDCFMIYLTIPFFMTLVWPAVCVYYASGEEARALFETVECGSVDHRRYAIVGGCVAVCVFAMGSAVGTIPVLVERATDMALNGRFTSTSFAIKCCIAVMNVLFADRHQFIHLGAVFFLLCCLLFLNITLRPCLVERVNYHRSTAYCLAICPCVMIIIAAGMDDIVTYLPITFGIVVTTCVAVMLLSKYFLLTSGKLFPAIDYMGGKYEGGICLGLGLPHGYGILKWEKDEDEGKTFAGKFIFGRYHGYGVVTQRDCFFQGTHKLGLREGFGVTNIMPNLDELSYEGHYLNNLYHGEGTKRFDDGDVYEGEFVEGIEHGEGAWSFDTALGRHTARGRFENGIFVNVQLQENERYNGKKRYGVPHGLGRMDADDEIFEGEWRAGKLHGHGTVKIEAGEYEGLFVEGAFNDEGTWRDEQETYRGKWKDGLKHGPGVQELDNGRYEGQFFEGMRHGYGTFEYKDGTKYMGSWQYNNYHGAGLLQNSDGAEYDGNWNEGHRHGTRGCITFPTGEKYTGGWSEDEYHDHGVLVWPNMGEFNGRFEFGKRHGLGRFTFYDGSEYVGEWAEDLAHGEGRFVFSSRKALMVLQIMSLEDEALQSAGERYFLDYGGVYEGEFAEGAMAGEGTVVCGDGTVYKGEWTDGLPHGHGVLSYPGGGEYNGEFFMGLRDGQGKMYYEDHRLYNGSWETGRRHGHGVLFSAEGDVLHDCEWTNDVPNDAEAEAPREINIPHVDVDELLRAIMPKHMSNEEVEETRERRRLEIEETWEANAIRIWLEEEMQFRRLLRMYVSWREREPRAAIMNDEDEASRALSKPLLVKLLNEWKQGFRTWHERDPKKSDILHDDFIRPFYVRYQEIVKFEKDAV